MNCIIAIDLLPQLTTRDLPKKVQGCILLAEKGFLSRYAMRKGVAVMSLSELEEECGRRCRDHRRKNRLKSYFDGKVDIIEIENHTTTYRR